MDANEKKSYTHIPAMHEKMNGVERKKTQSLKNRLW